ncbi:MAG TPA: YidC/Oxa1 family membrane protein insertase [Acidimicrobiia bacterium]|nr:YidC/Oxa1 family membrane protein insertase [Acidimicrobiia bacterium]
MGEIFNTLIDALGSVLAFFFDFLHGFMDDGVAYGVSIILLTIVINIVVFPLTLKQTRATRAFQALQPEIKRIQAEYKDDPQELQKRLMAAQKEAGATPGGCLLPLLVQMPIWFALFRLLGAPLEHINPDTALGISIADGTANSFLGMMLDTSPADAMAAGGVAVALPYLIMIVLMVATQYIQQWHSTYGQVSNKGQPGAGAQQAITKIMPLFIGFISWNFPAGLVVYWATSNLFRLGQQVLIFKIDGRPPSQSSNGESNGSKNDRKSEDSSDTEPKKPQQGASSKRRRRRRR